MIKITVDTEENNIKVTCEVRCSKCNDAVEEFKVLNKNFPSILAELLKKFPLYVQAKLLTEMLEDAVKITKERNEE